MIRQETVAMLLLRYHQLDKINCHQVHMETPSTKATLIHPTVPKEIDKK